MGQTHDFAMFWAETGLAQKALNEGLTLHNYNNNGTLKDDAVIVDVVKEIQDSLFEGVVVFHRHPATKGGDEEWMMGDGSGSCCINIDYTHRNRSISFGIHTTNHVYLEALKLIVKRVLGRKVTKGRVYVVAQSERGPYLHEMGVAGEPVILSNYRPEVAEDYRHIVADLNDPDPCGRIILLNGEPGGGKTYLVRALLNEVPKGTFVMIPSNMMSGLGSPNFIKAILREQKRGYPMILVVEDADEAIAKRDRGNLSEISSLLNFSDGIFGAVMDIRIIATTNAPVDDLDPAVMRPGRLCRRIEIGKLDPDMAQSIYERLQGKDKGLFTAGNLYTLAEVYQAARGSGVGFTPRRAKARIGFGVDNSINDTPFNVLGLKPGDLATTDTGKLLQVMEDGELEVIKVDTDSMDDADDDDDFDDEETPDDDDGG
jgi:hypothetical protein